MSGSKHFDKIAWAVTALILVITILFMNGSALGLEAMAHTIGYENRLFDNTKVHSLDIVMNDWEEFIADAASEEYYTADLVIDGEAYKNVAIRGKGNTSLSTVSSMNSERYSFKVEFDHYDSSITYHGLDKLSLNNLIQDSTMMKDYLTYTMMNEFGAAAPLCSFVYITVNGEDWGLYLAVEGIEDSFLERNYGSDYGELYKPDSLSFGGGRGNGKDFNMDDFINSGEASDGAGAAMPEMGGFDPSQMFGNNENGGFSFGGMGGFGMGSSDVKLQYIDDDADSYSNIWNGAKTDISTADKTRLIESLKKLSNGEEIESVVDIEQVIRYFVVHNYVCNGDSYTGSMIHNYYLYEENGQMTMIPWDYNLAFGTFQGGSAQSTVNTPIDAPVSGGSGEDRPMWSWILSDESYTELYHQYFDEFINTVDIGGIIDDTYNLIKAYVEKDPTAFYTYEEFETGVSTLKQFCALRTESISMQLDNGETVTDMSYVDASELNLSAMGSMGGMGGFSNMPSGFNGFSGEGMGDSNTASTDENEEIVSVSLLSSSFPNFSGQMPGGFGGEMPEGFDPSQGGFGGQMPDMGEMPEGFDPSQGGFGGQMPDMGEMPENFDSSQLPEEFDGSFPGQSSDESQTAPPEDSDSSAPSENTEQFDSGSSPSGGGMQIPEFNMNGMGNTAEGSTEWLWLAVSVLVLGIGLVAAKRYKC